MLGVTAAWLPPAYKGSAGAMDVGYGVYDLYDLGEFNQKGSVRTKYGTVHEYISAVRHLRLAGIQTLGDVVLNHRLGADETESVRVTPVNPDNRLEAQGSQEDGSVYTRFTFPGRGRRYSPFTWDHTCFTGTDWDEKTKNNQQIYRFTGKQWAEETDSENGNYDYLMGLDVDVSNPVVVRETKRWLRWYIRTTGIDGLRLDAVKHISFPFYRDLLKDIRKKTAMDLPAVGEYWSSDPGKLLGYLDAVDNEMSLFDVSLHYNFFNASQAGADFDLRTIFDNTLIKERPQNAVTFVDNHDTQYGQSLQSFVADWFRPHCYALILLRQEGLPCVFYSD